MKIRKFILNLSTGFVLGMWIGALGLWLDLPENLIYFLSFIAAFTYNWIGGVKKPSGSAPDRTPK